MTSDGWSALPGIDGPAERTQFDSLDFLEELAHPLRARIMRGLKDPHSPAELAESLDVPVTRLYHHVHRLEDAGMIHVVATRQVGAATERRYQVVALSFEIAPAFLESQDPDVVAAAVGSIYDMAKHGMQREIERGSFRFGDDDSTVISFGHMKLTAERRTELTDRLIALAKEFASDDPTDKATDHTADDATDEAIERFALFIAAHPDSG